MGHKDLVKETKLDDRQYLITLTQGISRLAEICRDLFEPACICITEAFSVNIPPKTAVLIPVKGTAYKKWFIVVSGNEKQCIVLKDIRDDELVKNVHEPHIALLLNCPFKDSLIR